MKKKKIFLGGSYFSPKEQREKVIKSAEIIEKTIKKCNFIPSMNLLTNKNIYEGTQVNTENVKFSNNKFFLEIGNDIISAKKQDIERIRGIRHFNNENEFILCCMASNIILHEMKESVGAIFELSEKSQGSYFELALLTYTFEIPVLALSKKDGGQGFNTVITGIPNRLLITKKYDESELESIVESFLTKDLPEKMLKNISFNSPIYLNKELDKKSKMTGLSKSELIRQAIEKYLELS